MGCFMLKITDAEYNFNQILNYSPEQKSSSIVTKFVETSLEQLAKERKPNYGNGNGYFSWLARTVLVDVDYSLVLGLSLGYFCKAYPKRVEVPYFGDVTTGMTPVILPIAISACLLVQRRFKKYLNTRISDRLASTLVPIVKEVDKFIRAKGAQLIKAKNTVEIIEFRKTLNLISNEKILFMRDSYLKAGFEWESTNLILSPLERSIERTLAAFDKVLPEALIE